MKKYVIVAPHADDEIIGCYELLSSGLVGLVLFGSTKGAQEAVVSAGHFRFEIETLENYNFQKQKNKVYLFPDPIYEVHPEHRALGQVGEALVRSGEEVIFYTVNMLAPYIHEVEQAGLKRMCLNKLYPNKNSLWEYDNRYFLFEGYVKWLMNSKNG